MSMIIRGAVVAGIIAGTVATAAPAQAALLNGCVYGDKHIVVEVFNKELVEVCYRI